MMYPYTCLQSHEHRQRGAVLVMSLVLLMVLTLIGLASMSGSSMQLRVASNMQQHNFAFQGAQSRIATATAQGAPSPINFKIAIPNNPPYPVQYCNPAQGCLDGVDWAATAQVVYKGCSYGFGNSLQAGKGISIRTFEVQVTATAKKGIARSLQYQGVLGSVKQCKTI